ncbi:glutathione S-transferase family protein [Salinisphaera sp. Q1T1-3]|uniref:glutathione S-transferase family protein n=1 Tax=Salinisphaera sp. Q1T1-3 TaxID=2321229 RepID=UPI000E722E25|nr:glutathione S-transferase family protein [Salinisphaera sp. Q1T1-3]RJS93827.1 glutathione S-transferase family protein [Salinisphaera sp. Q1T1-3]
MGLLINGVWHDRGYDTKEGEFVRESPGFRNWVAEGADQPFQPAAGRYHLYVSLACPWAHRTLILRRLKGLEDVIGLSIVDPYMGENGWWFSKARGTIPDTLYGLNYLYELYQKAAPGYTGRVTTPTLWDTAHETIVSNESADIVRMFNSAFDAFAGHPERDYYPAALAESIDDVNARVYDDVNNGVYKAGFATTQSAYEKAFMQLFETLDWLDDRLAGQRYVTGARLTEADWRLFVTLVRFDAVYHGHFKCNRRRIVDYPHLSGYLRELYQVPGVAETVDIAHIKQHYYRSHQSVNPTGVVPLGPVLDFEAEPGRSHLRCADD